MLEDDVPEPEAKGDSPDKVFEWTPSINQPLPDFQRRRRPPDKHPLLKKLLEAESMNLKHGDYTVHLLIQRQTRQYALAVDDVLSVLKKGTECITKTDCTWRGNDCGDLLLPIETSTDGSINSDLSVVGRQILLISEAIKRLQEESALTFWTSQQRVTVLQQLVSFSKDAVKLRRKLARIKLSLEDRLRNVRRIAIKCECEITGNLVPSEIYYQWVKEDSSLYKDNSCGTASISIQNMPKIKEQMSSVKETALKLIPCLKIDKDSSASESDSESETNDMSFMSQSTLNTGAPARVYQMDKHIDILYKVCGNSLEEDSTVCVGTLQSVAVGATPPPTTTTSTAVAVNDAKSPPPLDDVWTPRPSQKYLEKIACNVASPKKFTTYDFVYDHCESRIKEMSQVPVDEFHNQNTIITVPSNSNIIMEPEDKTDLIFQDEEMTTPPPLNSGNNDDSSVTAQKLFSDSMEKEISLIINAKNVMHDIVARATEAIRGMEREWVSAETFVKSKASGKELYELVDFIVETAKLTEDPEFASRLYAEDKDEIVSVLEPVLKELTNCFMSLHYLHNLVAVDAQYLKKLVSGIPKGGIVIRDMVSDPSIDEELVATEHPDVVSDFAIDVDALFD